MMKNLICFLLIVLSITPQLSAQPKKNTRIPFGTYNKHNRIITGISYGLWSLGYEPGHTTTNGLRLELLGEGILTPLIPESPIPDTDSAYEKLMHPPQSEKIRGISISGTGSVCDCLISGIIIGPFGQILTKVNGLSAAGFINVIQQTNGIQLALGGNNAYQMKGIQVSFAGNYAVKMYGIQIGLFNESKHTKGIQLGLWNRNEKRKWPIINWNFKS